jgi:hypothetical protein
MRARRLGLITATISLLALVGWGCSKKPAADPCDIDPDLCEEDLRKGDMKPTQDLLPPVEECKDKPPPQVDFAVPPSGGMIRPGELGSACMNDGQCAMGLTCWKSLLNNAGLIETPGGYCSKACMMHTQCGAGNVCVNFGAMFGSGCLAGCRDAVMCRHGATQADSYSCLVFGTDAMGRDVAACIPSIIFQCNPKTMATCRTRDGKAGACIRAAYEDNWGGFCEARCTLGDPCADPKESCLYVDQTEFGDAFRGTICIGISDMPKRAGEACDFINECEDGYECDRTQNGTNKCEKLCNLSGRRPTCDQGKVCKQAFSSCEAGLCR